MKLTPNTLVFSASKTQTLHKNSTSDMSGGHFCHGTEEHPEGIEQCKLQYEHKHCERDEDHIMPNRPGRPCPVPGCTKYIPDKPDWEEKAEKGGTFFGAMPKDIWRGGPVPKEQTTHQ